MIKQHQTSRRLPRDLQWNVSPERSLNMSRIRARDTKPELAVRRAIWAEGLRYRLHDKRLPGKPDLVFAGRRLVVFVHGCFWHGHEGCKDFRIPKTRATWWQEKITRNQVRDATVQTQLQEMGWQVEVIWECETSNQDKLRALIAVIQRSAGNKSAPA